MSYVLHTVLLQYSERKRNVKKIMWGKSIYSTVLHLSKENPHVSGPNAVQTHVVAQGLTVHARKIFLEELNSRGRGGDTGSGRRKEKGIPGSGEVCTKTKKDPAHLGTLRFRLRNQTDTTKQQLIFLEYLLRTRLWTNLVICTVSFNTHNSKRSMYC